MRELVPHVTASTSLSVEEAERLMVFAQARGWSMAKAVRTALNLMLDEHEKAREAA